MDKKRFRNKEAVEEQKMHLRDANLERANLSGAKLTDADLSGQNLDDLKSRGAIIITGQ